MKRPCAMVDLKLIAALPSGQTTAVTIQKSERVECLTTKVQTAFARNFLRLMHPNGSFLDLTASIDDSGLKDGDTINVIVQQPKIAATTGAFALWAVGSNRVVTWGRQDLGGDSSRVADRFHGHGGVQDMVGNNFGFAALLADKTVVSWGYCVELNELHDVDKVYATSFSFAAILANKSVVTWGCKHYGGDSEDVEDDLVNVSHIYSNEGSFAAILESGRLVVWGLRSCCEGAWRAMRSTYGASIRHISSTDQSMAAIMDDGSVVTWGIPTDGGDSSRVQVQLNNVIEIKGSIAAFAALLEDRTVVTWGSPQFGGDSSDVQPLINVMEIHTTGTEFAAILEDRTVVSWPPNPFDSSRVQSLMNVAKIYTTTTSFAALLENGTVVTWGEDSSGGDSSQVQDQLRDVQQIFSTWRAFAAILGNGHVVAWGDPKYGGDCSRVQNQLQNVQQIYSTESAFAAVLTNSFSSSGVICWGREDEGGTTPDLSD